MTSFTARPRKKFGQHWLRSEPILSQIVAAAQLTPTDRVLEIGPGTGLLTRRLLPKVSHLVAVEVDRDLCRRLRQHYNSEPRFQLIEADFLALADTALGAAAAQRPNKVVANIPYYITGPILERLLGTIAAPNPYPYASIVLLVQGEVADRLCASPGSKACGALTVRVQYLADCEIICPVPPQAFQPPPKVASAVVRLRPRPPAVAAVNPALLARLVTLGFANKRKMLRNNLGGWLGRDRLLTLLADLGLPDTIRAEALAVGDWVALSNRLHQQGFGGDGLEETGAVPSPPEQVLNSEMLEKTNPSPASLWPAMRAYTLRTSAKINLHLEILGDRPDGFHELVMVMQSVDLADTLTLRSLPGNGIRLQCDHPLVPQDETNLAYRAAQLMAQRFPQVYQHQGGVEITLEKAIPVGAGLAGGSGNAAAVLVGMNLLWELGLTQGELQEIGAKLGSDVPFCISGGTAIATGRGEQLDPLPGGLDLYVVLAKYQSLSVSTPWAYQTYRQTFGHTYRPPGNAWGDRRQALHAGPLVRAISQRQGAALGQSLYNDLERVVLPAHPPVAHLRDTLAACGGLGTLMSGSGPTVFTLVNSQADGEALVAAVRDRISDPDLGLWVARFQDYGIQLVSP